MLETFLSQNTLRWWSKRLTLRERSQRGLLHRNDLFVADPCDPPLILLLDGTTGSGAAMPQNPRQHLFSILTAAWPSLRTLSPSDVLLRIGDELRMANQSSPKRAFASAVCARPDRHWADWEVAEAGDTKVFVYKPEGGQAVFNEGLPQSDHRVVGLLGTRNPQLRSQRLQLPRDHRLLLITDGAFHVLSNAGLANDRGEMNGDVLAGFDAHSDDVEDDATMVLLNPHVLAEGVL